MTKVPPPQSTAISRRAADARIASADRIRRELIEKSPQVDVVIDEGALRDFRCIDGACSIPMYLET